MVELNTLILNKRTAKGKQWKLPELNGLDPEILAVVDNSEILAKILQKRGIKTAVEAKAFLDPTLYQATSPAALPGMDKALVRIKQAIEQNEHITIYGDYDVDGVTGTSVLLTVLRELGAKVDFYIPNRMQEGYGLNLKAISVLASKHRTKLIITCDCGVSNFAEINFASSLGVDTLVFDHHSLPELLPPAVSIVHPKLLASNHPLYNLPGVGVAYKVCEAILIDRGLENKVEELLDYVTLGMIADLVPLIAENRYLVQIGLPKLINSSRPGIQALLAQVRKSEDTDLVGFGLAPRINAVGRLAEAKTAVELLTTSDAKVAEELSRQLHNENTRRQEICEQVFFEADQMIKSQVNLEKDKAIAIYKEGWHHGVVGIVASRLVEKYGRPVFIAELDKEENLVKGSARSIDAIDLYEVLKVNEQLLSKWGGHKMAAGFSVSAEKAQVLCRSLVDTCNKFLAGKPAMPVLEIDLSIEETDISLELTQLLNKLAPFGMANKKPQLALRGLKCQENRPLGKDAKHHRLMLKSIKSETIFECVMWNSYGKIPTIGEEIELVFTPEINTFNGKQRLQLILIDWCSINAEVVIEKNTPAVDCSVPEKPTTEVIPSLASGQAISNWKDLRTHSDPHEILTKGMDKFGDQLIIFAENIASSNGFKLIDRSSMTPAGHLIIWQFPPALKIFQELIIASQAANVYLIGNKEGGFSDVNAFIKHLLGLIRFTVSKRDGHVSGDKLTSAMGTTKMATALGLGILRKLSIIDWYAEEGEIYLDFFGTTNGTMEDLPEYRQLTDMLKQIELFRQWCAKASLKEIKQAIAPSQINLASANFAQVNIGVAEGKALGVG